MTPKVSMRTVLTDPDLLGWVMPGASWAAWRTVLIAMFGEALTDDERVIWAELTGGREHEPGERVEEALWLCGRRAGKSRAASVVISYVSGLCSHDDALAPGERGLATVLSATTKQAQVIFGYTRAIFQHSPLLAGLVDGETADSLALSNGVDIEIRPASFRSTRGVTSILVIGDEVAFWPTDGSLNPDTEILGAVRPSLATTGGMMILATTPYGRRGEAWGLYKANYGAAADPRIPVIQAPSRTMNPTLPQSVVDRALARDRPAAEAEYLAKFRVDVEALLTIEAVEACVAPAVRERAYSPAHHRNYRAFVDLSGGSSDSATLCIAHAEDRTAVIDLTREIRPPFSPEAVITEFAAILKAFGLRSVTGDAYAGLWPRERFAVHGITYEVADKNKSLLYLSLVATVNSGSVLLLDDERLTGQLVSLERRTTRGGRDLVDHPPNGHDDLANAVAGAIERCLDRPAPYTGPLSGLAECRMYASSRPRSSNDGSNPLCGTTTGSDDLDLPWNNPAFNAKAR